ncbi:transmembrane protein, putative (macronuclear) [Tetrahymena thermophila SB210]|uniref:Transmembrane protein, putative n=1 Tax=Tetrahymena thermophila (strain SB210) TaxID=312017 RepID=W7WZA8_TETTS|nr:transmembrane protein, putative [Tetrahymena thermophila SB210]EWS70942.1 transmembrane protein, putative [Tetrahymena thermophila SB210]|eukprot:XP_012656498.1 transmembrane protein, putative [Tetrahymena thermophila SB210]
MQECKVNLLIQIKISNLKQTLLKISIIKGQHQKSFNTRLKIDLYLKMIKGNIQLIFKVLELNLQFICQKLIFVRSGKVYEAVCKIYKEMKNKLGIQIIKESTKYQNLEKKIINLLFLTLFPYFLIIYIQCIRQLQIIIIISFLNSYLLKEYSVGDITKLIRYTMKSRNKLCAILIKQSKQRLSLCKLDNTYKKKDIPNLWKKIRFLILFQQPQKLT